MLTKSRPGRRYELTTDAHEIAVGARDHAVTFYEDDVELASTVGSYLAEAIQAGGIGVAIATDAHRHEIERALRTCGVNLPEAVGNGSLVLLDAAATIARFVRSEQIDRVAFDEVVGSVIREAADRDTPIHAFGDMVALLWEAGDVLVAIELEELWNDLRQQHEFSLLCGCPASSVAGPEHAAALEDVCRLHSSGRGLHTARVMPGPTGYRRSSCPGSFPRSRTRPGPRGACWPTRSVSAAMTRHWWMTLNS